MWKNIIVAIAYFLTAILSDHFTTYPETGSTPIWIAGGVGVGLLYIWGDALWLGLLMGILIAEIYIYSPWLGINETILTVTITAISTLGKLFAVYLMKLSDANSQLFSRVKSTIKFSVYGCFLSHLPVAILCALMICLLEKASWELYIDIAFTWWLSDAFGILIVAPLIIVWCYSINGFLLKVKTHYLTTITITALTIVTVSYTHLTLPTKA